MAKSKFLKQFNNSQVVGVTTASEVRDFSHQDARLLRNMDFSDHKKSLGMLELFENAQIVKVPFLKDIMTNSDYIYVNGREGSFDYEIPMDLEYCTVVENVEEGEYLGIDGGTFQLKTSHPFRQGDIITYDLIDGVQLDVVEDSDVVDVGDGFIHSVTLHLKDREAYLDPSKLKNGTRFYKVGDSLGEYSTQFSGITATGAPQKMKLEYTIGSPQGVEVSYTDYSNSMSLNGQKVADYLGLAHSLVDGIGVDLKEAYLYTGITKNTKNPKKLVGKTVKVEKLMHVLAMAELYKMLSTRMMFSHAATITGINGSKRVNEGIYPQMRRGHRFTYRNTMEMRSMITLAANTIFSGMTIPLRDRNLKFKAGYNAHNLVLDIFNKEFTQTFPVPLTAEALGGTKLLTGDRNNITYHSFQITKAFLKGIGYVELEHDVSMDYDFGDIVLRGYNAGLSKRSWSLVISDITDERFTNVYNKGLLPKGVTVDKRASGKNLYIVRPENEPEVSFGVQTGRMSGTNVKSSMRHMGEEFWCTGQIDAWIPDLGRVVLIERVDAISEDGIRYF